MGHFVRRFKLDERAQLWNALQAPADLVKVALRRDVLLPGLPPGSNIAAGSGI